MTFQKFSWTSPVSTSALTARVAPVSGIVCVAETSPAFLLSFFHSLILGVKVSPFLMMVTLHKVATRGRSSRTKSVIIRLVRDRGGHGPSPSDAGEVLNTGRGDESKRHVEPEQLS